MIEKAAAPLHLAASLRVVSAHLHVRFADIATARETVLDTARQIAAGEETPELMKLAAKLERVTGCSIGELAAHAAHWA